jgi:hypothetical protein
MSDATSPAVIFSIAPSTTSSARRPALRWLATTPSADIRGAETEVAERLGLKIVDVDRQVPNGAADGLWAVSAMHRRSARLRIGSVGSCGRF